MKCQNCGKNEVNVHLRQNINGQVSEYELCSECAEKLGVGGMFSSFGSFGGFGGMGLLGFDPFAGFDAFDSLLGGMLGGGVKALPQTKTCKGCGSTFDDIAKRGKAGCADCYTEFGERLAPSIERLHGRVKHVGKLPGRSAPKPETKSAKNEPASKTETVDGLRAQLKAAIANEEYEKAAVLRDRIKEMER